MDQASVSSLQFHLRSSPATLAYSHSPQDSAMRHRSYAVPDPDNLPPARPDHRFARRPTTKWALFFWKRRMWIESTFALTVYEPWEKVVVLSIFAILCAAMMIVLVNYLPRQLIFMRRRMFYYLYGMERDDRALWQYLGLGLGRGVDNAVVNATKEM